MKMKHRSNRYDINKPRSRHGHSVYNGYWHMDMCQYHDCHMYQATAKQHLRLNLWKS